MNKSDRTTVLALLCVIAAALVVFYLAGEDVATTNADDGTLPSDSASFAERPAAALSRSAAGASNAGNQQADPSSTAETPAELFHFDPNTADSNALMRLGLRRWQVENIYKYRQAGGIYSRPEDFARLYGLTVGQYRRLKPYIRIGRDYQPAATLLSGRAGREAYADRPRDTLSRAVKLSADETIDLCTADTGELRRVPGIGTYYASRIYSYGQRLGGYVSVDQLDEVDELPPGLKRYFVVNGAAPRKLNVNKLTLNELRRHPYIGFYQAKTIVDYRRQHGRINSLEELKLSRDFPPEAIRRLLPYVEY